MAISKVNFQLVTPMLPLIIRDYDVDFAGTNMPANILPNTVLEDDGATAAKALLDGEWMKLSAGGKITRAGVSATKSAAYGGLLFPLYAEKGRTDIQALSKVPVIFGGTFEADTTIALTGDQGNFAIGDRLVVIQGLCEAAGYAKYSVLAIGTSQVLATSGTIPMAVYEPDLLADTTGSLVTSVRAGMTVGYVTRAWNATSGLRVYCRAGGFGVGA